MPTVREYFAREAGDYLDRLERVLEGLDRGSIPPANLHRGARALRGSAQMAREAAVAQVATALERVARAVAEGHVRWTPDLSGRVGETLRDVRALLRAEPDEAPAVVKGVLERLSGLGGPAGRPQTAGVEAQQRFRDFAARESAAVLASVEAALQAIAVDARDRESLKAVLRRQRALMGAARLPSIPLLAEVLTAVDEITRLVARLDVAVEDEWLESYRAARDVLAALVPSLQRGSEPAPGAALARLRALRQELLDRYGAEEPMRQPPVLTPEDAAAAVAPAPSLRPGAARPAATGGAALAETSRASAVPPPSPAGSLAQARPVEEFLYRGERALARARELRPELERALIAGNESGARAGELLAELFDLIELAQA